MPQANITYDAPYNRSMVNFIEELDKKHWEKAYPAYHPNPMGFRLGTFHGEPVSEVKVGGGSSPEKWLRSGNSPAYPPHNMRSGMAVSSGGSRLASVDGAVGGEIRMNPFDFGFNFGHDVLGPAIFGSGRRARKPRVKKGGDFWSDMKEVGHQAGEPFALVPDMLFKSAFGLGRKTRAKKGGFDIRGALSSIGNELKDPAKQIAKELFEKEARKRLGLGRGRKSGGFDISDIHVKDLALSNKVGGFDILGALSSIGNELKEPAKQIGKELFEKEARKRLGLGRKSGGFDIRGALSSIGNELKDPAKQIAKEFLEKEARKRLGLGRKTAPAGGASRGRSARAEIVKKVMREKGMKMIEASKYVKAHGLY